MIRSSERRLILLQDRHPALFEAYREHFVEGFEHRHYATRTGHVKPTDPAGLEKYLGTWRRAKAWGRVIPFPHDLSSRNRLIEKHLGVENWNRHVDATGRGKPLGEPFFFGLCASKTTRHVVIDIDCHGGRRLHYRRRGRRVPVADLGLDTLRDVKRLYDLDRPPDVLMTSGPSLGLHAYFQFRRPMETKAAIEHYGHLARSVGLECEIYPSFTNCLRRPMGDGSFALSPWGILREFADQMRYYLDPEPPPPFPVVVEMLLSLWAEEHEEMAAHHDGDFVRDWRDPEIDPVIERDYMLGRADEIRAWLSSGGAGAGAGDDPRTCDSPAEIARGSPSPLPKTEMRDGSQAWPDVWKEPNMRWRDRIWHLATFGLPTPDTLNCALLDLAQWLIGVEFYDDDDRDDQVRRLLKVFCASRHNDQSDRLRGVGDVECLPNEVRKEISTALTNAYDVVEKETFLMMRRRSYKTPLRVASLLTGEGTASLYRPIAAGDLPQQETKPLASPLSVAVSPATFLVGGNNGISLEAMLAAGTLDDPLPRSIEERITKRGKVLLFLRRLGNYLWPAPCRLVHLV